MRTMICDYRRFRRLLLLRRAAACWVFCFRVVPPVGGLAVRLVEAAGLAVAFLAAGVAGFFAAPLPLGSVASPFVSASIAGGAAGWNNFRSPPAAFGAGGASSTSITPFD